MSNYDLKDIYDIDETGLLYNLCPLVHTFKHWKRAKRNKTIKKKRISVLVCCNSDGSDKLKLMVVGKSKIWGVLKIFL